MNQFSEPKPHHFIACLLATITLFAIVTTCAYFLGDMVASGLTPFFTLENLILLVTYGVELASAFALGTAITGITWFPTVAFWQALNYHLLEVTDGGNPSHQTFATLRRVEKKIMLVLIIFNTAIFYASSQTLNSLTPEPFIVSALALTSLSLALTFACYARKAESNLLNYMQGKGLLNDISEHQFHKTCWDVVDNCFEYEINNDLYIHRPDGAIMRCSLSKADRIGLKLEKSESYRAFAQAFRNGETVTVPAEFADSTSVH